MGEMREKDDGEGMSGTRKELTIFSDKKSKIKRLFLKENPNVGFLETDSKWYEQAKE